MIIHETDFGANNFSIQRAGDLLRVDLSYPPYTDADNPTGKRRKVRKIAIDQTSTRSSDGIRVSYDYERDGWVIEQRRYRVVDPSPDETDPEPEMVEDWSETAFLAAWARQQPGDLPWCSNEKEETDV